jgi:LPPG:FO 2-phospho-L-lactate transferase
VIDAIMKTNGVIIAPSNPLISIGPILAVPGVREALQKTPAPVAAISPIIGGKALKGPADRMLNSLGFGSSAIAVAGLYRDFVDVFVLDDQDAALCAELQNKNTRAIATQTVMISAQTKQALARAVLTKLRSA